MWTRDQIREKFVAHFKTRDRAQWAHSLIAGAVGPVVMAVGSAILSLQSHKALGWSLVAVGAVLCVVFGFLAVYIIPHSFYELAFELEERDKRIRAFSEQTKRFVLFQRDFRFLSNVAVYARRKSAPPDTWTPDSLRTVLKDVLLPLEGQVEKIFDMHVLDYWCLAVHVATTHNNEAILKCVHRFRNFETDWTKFPPRDLPAKTIGGGHIGFTFESKESHAARDLSEAEAHELNGEICMATDVERYVSFLSFPIFPPGSGNGEDPIGVVSVTCNKKDHFGSPKRNSDHERVHHWKRYFHTIQLLAQLLSSVIGRVTLVNE